MLQIAGLAVVSALMWTIVRPTDQALAAAAVLLFSVLAVLAAAHFLSPVGQFIRELSQLTGVGASYLVPIAKTCAIALLTQTAACICSEAGASTLAQITQLCGSVAGLYLLLPLLRAVLDLFRSLIGG